MPSRHPTICMGRVCTCSSFEKEKSTLVQSLGNVYVLRKSSAQISLLQVNKQKCFSSVDLETPSVTPEHLHSQSSGIGQQTLPHRASKHQEPKFFPLPTGQASDRLILSTPTVLLWFYTERTTLSSSRHGATLQTWMKQCSCSRTGNHLETRSWNHPEEMVIRVRTQSTPGERG